MAGAIGTPFLAGNLDVDLDAALDDALDAVEADMAVMDNGNTSTTMMGGKGGKGKKGGEGVEAVEVDDSVDEHAFMFLPPSSTSSSPLQAAVLSLSLSSALATPQRSSVNIARASPADIAAARSKRTQHQQAQAQAHTHAHARKQQQQRQQEEAYTDATTTTINRAHRAVVVGHLRVSQRVPFVLSQTNRHPSLHVSKDLLTVQVRYFNK